MPTPDVVSPPRCEARPRASQRGGPAVRKAAGGHAEKIQKIRVFSSSKNMQSGADLDLGGGGTQKFLKTNLKNIIIIYNLKKLKIDENFYDFLAKKSHFSFNTHFLDLFEKN